MPECVVRKKSQVKAELISLLRRLRIISDANAMTLSLEFTDLKIPKKEKYRFDIFLVLYSYLGLTLPYKIPISVQSKFPGPKWNALFDPIMWASKLKSLRKSNDAGIYSGRKATSLSHNVGKKMKENIIKKNGAVFNVIQRIISSEANNECL
jgi:hypothetical protein